MRLFSLFCFLFLFQFTYSQSTIFQGSWQVTEVSDPYTPKLPMVSEQYIDKVFHFYSDKLILEDEYGYLSIPATFTENTIHYHNASLTIIEQSAKLMQVSFMDKNHDKELILQLAASASISNTDVSTIEETTAAAEISTTNSNGFYYYLDSITYQYHYYRFYPENIVVRTESELSPEKILPYLHLATNDVTQLITTAAEGRMEWKISFSDVPELDLTKRGRIIYRDYKLTPQSDQLVLQLNETSNFSSNIERSNNHPLQFFPSEQLTHRILKPIESSQKRYRIDYQTLAGSSPINESPYFIAAEMPRFPGCEKNKNLQKRSQCSQKNLLTYIYANVKYPPAARENKIEGTVVISFNVHADGSIADIKLRRSISDDMDAEALRVIAQMYYDDLRWTPGTRDGIPVDAVRFNLPIKFRLQ